MSESDQEHIQKHTISALGEISSVEFIFDRTQKLIKQASITTPARVYDILGNDSHPNDNKLNLCYNTDFDKMPLVIKVEKDAVFSPNNNPYSLQKPFKIPEMFRCLNCDTNFSIKHRFERHQCKINAEKIVQKLNIDVQDVQMKFECSTCGKLFVSKNNFERHLTSHDEDNVNICEHCNKRFVSANRLRIHKENYCKKAGDVSKIYRREVKVFKCIKCYQVFSSDVFAYNHDENCSEIYDLNEINNIPVEDMEKNKGILINGSRFIQVVVTETLLQCEFCNKTFADKKSVRTHQDTHTTAVNYNCIFCEETFDSYVVAAKHWLTKCSQEANLFFLPKLTYCQECDGTFKSHNALYSHKIRNKHYTIKKYEIIKNDQAIDDQLNNGPQILNVIEGAMGTNFNIVEETLENVNFDNQHGFRYQCEQCSLVFKTIQSLEGHRDKDHPANYKCEECNQVLHSSMALMKHSRDHQGLKPYVCDICGRSYLQKSHLGQHMRFHQGIKPFACPHDGCEARYTLRPELKNHIRKVHTKERPFECPVCNKSFMTASVYYQHRLIHTNDRRYTCEMCSKRFHRRDALKHHTMIHTGERPYACQICGRNFRQKGDLNKHIRTQHPNAQV